MFRSFGKAVCLVVVFLLSVGSVYSYETNKEAVAVRAPGEFDDQDRDGWVDPVFWAKAPKDSSDFWNREDGSKMSVKTEFQVVYDEKNIYIYVSAFDTDPLTMAEKVQDGPGIYQYDCLAVELFMPGAQLNWFVVEPRGGKDHYIGSGSGANPDFDIGTRVFPGEGWAAQFRISWSTVDIPLTGEVKVGFGIDRRKQNPTWEWGDWSYIGREENAANFGSVLVTLSKRPIKASLALESNFQDVFKAGEVEEAEEDEKAKKIHPTATLFFTSHSTRATVSAYPYDQDIARDVSSVLHSYFAWKQGEWRNLLLENRSIFTRNQPGYYGMGGYELFHSPTIGDIKAGTNIVYKHRFFTIGNILLLNKKKDNNLVLRGLGGMGSTNFGGHFMTRRVDEKMMNVGSLDLTYKGTGYHVLNELAYTGSGISGLREEGKLSFFFKRWEPSISWLVKGEDHLNLFSYDPMPAVYGVYPRVSKKFIFERKLLKEFLARAWTDYFRYWREDRFFYTSLGFRLWVETKEILGINHAAYVGVERKTHAEWDEEEVYQRNKDIVASSFYMYNYRGQNKFNLRFSFGDEAGHSIQTIRFWGQLNAGLTGIKALEKLTCDLNLDHEKHWEDKNQVVVSLNYGEVDQYGLASRYVWREIGGERQINNVYFAGWVVWREIFEAHARVGLPNKEKFVPDFGFKLVGKLPISDWVRRLLDHLKKEV